MTWRHSIRCVISGVTVRKCPQDSYVSLHGWNKPYTRFLSKVGFPSDSYIFMLAEPPPLLIQLMNINFLICTSMWYVRQYEHILLIMISVNFYHSHTFHFVLKKKTKKLWLSTLDNLIYCEHLKVSHLLKTIRRCHLLLKRFAIDWKKDIIIYIYI